MEEELKEKIEQTQPQEIPQQKKEKSDEVVRVPDERNEGSIMRRAAVKVLTVIFWVASMVLHGGALFIIYRTIQPIVEWYLTKSPIRGVDTFLSAVYVHYIVRWGEYLRPDGFKYIWFGGYPHALDYPSLYFLAMIPFVRQLGLIPGVMYFAVFGLLLLVVSSYFLFAELSRNRAVALLLAVAVGLSSNIYRQMIWAGSIPYFVSQAFLPLVGFLVVRFLNSRNYKWLYAGAIVAGLGLLGHPQPFLNVIMPFCFLALWFYGGRDGLKRSRRFLDTGLFFGLFILVGLPMIAQSGTINLIGSIFLIFKSLVGGLATNWSGVVGKDLSSPVLEGTALDLINYHKRQFLLVYSDSVRIIWFSLGAFLALWVVTLIFRAKRIRSIFSVLPFVLFLAYEIGVIFLFSRGIDILVNHWNKALWPVPIAAGAVAAVLFGQTFSALDDYAGRLMKTFKVVLAVVISLAALLTIYFSFPNAFVRDSVSYLDSISSPSSAYPDALNVKIGDGEREEVARRMYPDYVDPNDRNKRLYAIDATVNLAWNTMFNMPLARGYIDPPVQTMGRWGLFWLDSVLGPSGKGQESSLMLDWNVPKEVVDENIKFLLDWNSVYYLLGNYQSENPNSLASNVTTSDYIEKNTQVEIPGVITRYELDENLKPLGERYYPERNKILNWFKVKSELVSPIIAPNRATAVLLVGDDTAYDTIYRFLGMKNLNSQRVVVATRSENIDDYSLEEMQKFDAVILYRYDYHSGDRAFKRIGEYLSAGGKVYVDTGWGGPESSGSNMPEFFPFKSAVRRGIGVDWNIDGYDPTLGRDVNFSNFSPLDFDGEVWNVSYPEDDRELNSQAKVLLRNNGKVVAASVDVGEGRLIWSGFNFPYHVIRDYNKEEAQFLENILGSLVSLSEKRIGESRYNWISPEERQIKSEGARAVLFKEEAYPNWKAKSDGETYQIYKAGPTYPGFMYVPFRGNYIPEELTFKFSGEIKWWIYYLISIATILLISDKILTGGRTILVPVRIILKLISSPTSKWWKKEDE